MRYFDDWPSTIENETKPQNRDGIYRPCTTRERMSAGNFSKWLSRNEPMAAIAVTCALIAVLAIGQFFVS